MEFTASELWSRVLASAREGVPEQSFRTWLAASTATGLSEHELIVEAASIFHAEWVEDKYGPLLRKTVLEILGRPLELTFRSAPNAAGPKVPTVEVGDPTNPFGGDAADGAELANRPGHRADSGFPSRPRSEFAGTAPAGTRGDIPAEEAKRQAGLNDRYTFDRFVVGANNQLAAAACRAVSERPGRIYNPLFLYGGVGLGKTHLMHAVGHMVLDRAPNARVAYVSTERFMNELVNSIQQGTTAAFRRRFRMIDLLLVDDVHFLAQKEGTQEEFFHTFNALYENGKQLVLTSDRPPKELAGVEDRLVSRFEWGLVTDIQAPDLETRLAILQTKAADERATVPPEALRYIATYITNNIRELEGALITLLAYSRLTKQVITPELTENVLGDHIGKDRIKPINIDAVLRAVADHFDVRLSELRGQSREKHVTRPRHIAMFLCKRLIPSLSLSEIGEAFGGKDHTTVIHACRRIAKVLESEADLRQIVNHLEKVIRS